MGCYNFNTFLSMHSMLDEYFELNYISHFQIFRINFTL